MTNTRHWFMCSGTEMTESTAKQLTQKGYPTHSISDFVCSKGYDDVYRTTWSSGDSDLKEETNSTEELGEKP